MKKSKLLKVRRRGGKQLFKTSAHPGGSSRFPIYEIRQKKLFPTIYHPNGASHLAWFTIKGRDIYPSIDHPSGLSEKPWFRIGFDKVYPSIDHPDLGEMRTHACFEIREKKQSSIKRNRKPPPERMIPFTKEVSRG